MCEVISLSDRLPVTIEDPDGAVVNEDLVVMLEDLLQQAKSGELTGMAYAGARSDAGICSGWTSSGLFQLLAASNVLHGRLTNYVVNLS